MGSTNLGELILVERGSEKYLSWGTNLGGTWKREVLILGDLILVELESGKY